MPGYLVVCFIECTQFIPGTLDQLYTGAFVVYNLDSSDDPWWLSFLESLFYVPGIISEMTDSGLQVYLWPGPLTLGTHRLFFLKYLLKQIVHVFKST